MPRGLAGVSVTWQEDGLRTGTSVALLLLLVLIIGAAIVQLVLAGR